MLRQHLGAEADAEKRLLLLERHRDPVDLAAHEVVRIIGALGTAEDDRAGVLREGIGQRIAETRPADVERKTARRQVMSDPSGRRQLLVQHQQHRAIDGRNDSIGMHGSVHDRQNPTCRWGVCKTARGGPSMTPARASRRGK
jgi:hypothetical protein